MRMSRHKKKKELGEARKIMKRYEELLKTQNERTVKTAGTQGQLLKLFKELDTFL